MELPPGSPLEQIVLTIKNSGDRAAAIVQDLLTLARRGVAVEEVVTLNDIVEEYFRTPEHQKLQDLYPQVQFTKHLAKEPFRIVGSPVHLLKVVANLVSNAVEAMPEGGTVSVITENKVLTQSYRGYDLIKEGEYAVLTVADSGIGISLKDLNRIFEPFYTKKVMGRSGTGLGLAVVWGTIRDHKGYIDVESIEGKGTQFHLYFPTTQLATNHKNQAISPEELQGKEKILIVDDIPEQREVVSLMLTKLGYEVTTVSSGERALEFLRENPVDLVILDMIMDGGLDGLETYKKILEMRPHQKAIVVSGYSETDRVKEAQELGAGPYVKKPFTLEKIGLVVRQELDRLNN
jgi:CheY-like chemotaxis protein